MAHDNIVEAHLNFVLRLPPDFCGALPLQAWGATTSRLAGSNLPTRFRLLRYRFAFRRARWRNRRFGCGGGCGFTVPGVGVGVAKAAEEGQSNVRSTKGPDVIRAVAAPVQTRDCF